VTNLHVWLLTVRLRALPAEHGRHYIQALIDHFFIDVEDRVRAVLQPRDPQPEPYTFESSFYLNPNALPKEEAESGEKRKRKLSRAPDRIVTRQMKIFKEQWAGLGLAFDLALVRGEEELAAAIRRNPQGIEYPAAAAASAPQNASFWRTVNLVGGEVKCGEGGFRKRGHGG
jgi:cytochrome b pre-mRNA-processing protein 3